MAIRVSYFERLYSFRVTQKDQKWRCWHESTWFNWTEPLLHVTDFDRLGHIYYLNWWINTIVSLSSKCGLKSFIFCQFTMTLVHISAKNLTKTSSIMKSIKNILSTVNNINRPLITIMQQKSSFALWCINRYGFSKLPQIKKKSNKCEKFHEHCVSTLKLVSCLFVHTREK